MTRLVLVACALGFLLPGAAVAQSVAAPVVDRPAPPRNCRVLAHQQPTPQHSAASSRGTSMTLVVIVPATTCNRR